MTVVVYLVAFLISIFCGSLAFAVVLWMNDDKSSFSDLKANFMPCVILNVITTVFFVTALGLGEVSPLLGIAVMIIAVIVYYWLVMTWFELSFLKALWLALVTNAVLSVSLVFFISFLTGVFGVMVE